MLHTTQPAPAQAIYRPLRHTINQRLTNSTSPIPSPPNPRPPQASNPKTKVPTATATATAYRYPSTIVPPTRSPPPPSHNRPTPGQISDAGPRGTAHGLPWRVPAAQMDHRRHRWERGKGGWGVAALGPTMGVRGGTVTDVLGWGGVLCVG